MRTRIRADFPRGIAIRLGTTSTSSAGAATTSRRVETLCSVTVARAPGRSASDVTEAVSSPAALAPTSTIPAPPAVAGAPFARALPTSRLRSCGAVSSGRACASTAAAPATAAAAALVPFTVANAGSPSGETPGSDVGSPMPGAAMSGSSELENERPRDEKEATRFANGFASRWARPTETPRRTPRRSPPRIARAARCGIATTGMSTSLESPSDPAGRLPP